MNLTAHDIVNQVTTSGPGKGWIVFKFNAVSTLLVVVSKIVLIALCSFALNAIVFEAAAQSNQNVMLPIGIFGFVIIFAAVSLIFDLIRLLYARSSMLVLTDSSLVISLSGKINQYPFSQVKKLMITQLPYKSFTVPYRIEFVDSATNKFVTVAQKRYFGPEPAIFNALNHILS